MFMFLLLLLCILHLITSVVAINEYNTVNSKYRCNNNNTGVNSNTPLKYGVMRWNLQLDGAIYATPIIDTSGISYVGTENGTLYAISEDQSILWVFNTNNAQPIYSTVAIFNDLIFFGSLDRYIYAVDMNGTMIWSYPTGNYIYASPAIGTDGTVYIGSYDYKLYALTSHGSMKWTYTTGFYIHSSAAINNGIIYVGSVDEYMYAINTDGTLIWRYKAAGAIYASPLISPTMTGNIYFGDVFGWVYALAGPGYADSSGVDEGTLLWKYRAKRTIYGSPAWGFNGTVNSGYNDAIYFTSYGGYVFALNMTGGLIWEFEAGVSG